MSLLVITVDEKGIQFIWWRLWVYSSFRISSNYDSLSNEDTETNKRCLLYSKQKTVKRERNEYLCKLIVNITDEVSAAQGSSILGKYYMKMKKNGTKSFSK